MALDRKDLAGVGLRLNGGRLLEQAGYTLGLARDEAQELAPFGVTKERLAGWETVRTQVQTAWNDRSISADESVALTDSQNRLVRDAKRWLRKVIQISGNAFAEEPTIYDEFTKIPRPQQSLPKLLEAMSRLTELCGKYSTRLAEWGGRALAKEGADLVAQIQKTDAGQERKLQDLPKKTEEFHVQKGRLFLAIKQINRAGKTAHLDDNAAAARYNLDILYRSAGRRSAIKTAEKEVAKA